MITTTDAPAWLRRSDQAVGWARTMLQRDHAVVIDCETTDLPGGNDWPGRLSELADRRTPGPDTHGLGAIAAATGTETTLFGVDARTPLQDWANPVLRVSSLKSGRGDPRDGAVSRDRFDGSSRTVGRCPF